MRAALLIAAAPFLLAQPSRTVWIRGAPPEKMPEAVARIRPNVHSVDFEERQLVVRSAGISLAYLGPLGVEPRPRAAPAQFTFRIPLEPKPETGRHAHIPASHAGVFINGVPIFNHFEAASYQGQNLWHYDLIARNARSNHAPPPPGLLEGLLPHQDRHSPLIGYALDGYPVYGPWSTAGRMHSSYRLRPIVTREKLPDGTLLAPGQSGPPVNTEYPLGAFVEDYEYVEGAGELDQFNGRFAVTPEYPAGTYAYFLSTSDAGRMAFPYLLAHEFRGQFAPIAPFQPRAKSGSLTFQYDPSGKLRFQLLDPRGRPLRHLEHIHQRPLHVLVLSHDLVSFAHLHPEVDEQGTWEVAHRFTHAGPHRIYADFTAPGGNQQVESFDIVAPFPSSPPPPPSRNPGFVLDNTRRLRAGIDLELQFRATAAIPDWRPYLGAWAHVIVAGDGLHSFLHAHPTEQLPASEAHEHTLENLGPPPKTIRVAVLFPRPGRYKIWLQTQIGTSVLATPFDVDVAAAQPTSKEVNDVPPGAISIRVTPHGYEPSRIEIPAGKPVTLAISRTADPNCGARIVFPAIGLTQELPPGRTTLLKLPAQPSGELRFTCGMGMYRGSVVIVTAAP